MIEPGTQQYLQHLQNWSNQQAADAHERHQNQSRGSGSSSRQARRRRPGGSPVALSEEQARKERIIFALFIICIWIVVLGGGAFALYWSLSGHGPQ